MAAVGNIRTHIQFWHTALLHIYTRKSRDQWDQILTKEEILETARLKFKTLNMVEPTLSWNRFLEVQRRGLNSTSMTYIKLELFGIIGAIVYPFLKRAYCLFHFHAGTKVLNTFLQIMKNKINPIRVQNHPFGWLRFENRFF